MRTWFPTQRHAHVQALASHTTQPTSRYICDAHEHFDMVPPPMNMGLKPTLFTCPKRRRNVNITSIKLWL